MQAVGGPTSVALLLPEFHVLPVSAGGAAEFGPEWADVEAPWCGVWFAAEPVGHVWDALDVLSAPVDVLHWSPLYFVRLVRACISAGRRVVPVRSLYLCRSRIGSCVQRVRGPGRRRVRG